VAHARQRVQQPRVDDAGDTLQDRHLGVCRRVTATRNAIMPRARGCLGILRCACDDGVAGQPSQGRPGRPGTLPSMIHIENT
jgi:hypothetical protein